MNKFIGMGRITRTPQITQSKSNEPMAIAKYSLAVNRRFKKDGQPDADFLNCIAFGKNAEFVEKWLEKGMLISIVGHLQTGNYINKDGIKVYTTDVIIEEQHFAEKKKQNTAVDTPSDFVPVDDFDDDLGDVPF